MSLLKIIKNNSTIVKNTGYLSAIELLKLVLPFIALPYIIKTIGTTNYGTIVFVQAIISYFFIFINFGLDISAVKQVSINRDNKTALNQIVSAVLTLKFILFCLSILILCISVFFVSHIRENSLLYIFVFSSCLSELLFPVWFYQGIEKMRYITIIRFLSVFFYVTSIFIFVRKADDYLMVPLLQSLGNILAGILALFFLLRLEKVRLIKPSYTSIKETFKESIPFFFSRLAVTANNTMARIVTGLFFSKDLVAALDLAQKIATFALVPSGMLNQAVYPHIAKTKSIGFVRKFFIFDICFSLFLAVSLYVSAPLIVKILSNELLLDAIPLVRILSIFVFLGGITTYIGTPVLVSFGHPSAFNNSVILSTLSLVIIYLLLYFFGLFSIYNFAFALVASEFIILIFRLYYCFHYRILAFK